MPDEPTTIADNPGTIKETVVMEPEVSQADQALTDLIAEHGDTVVSDNGRDSKGRFSPKAKTEAVEPVEDVQKGEGVEGDDLADKAPDADEALVQKAIRALQRDGMPKSVIDSMMKDPEALVAYGEKRSKVQADVDSYTEKHKAAMTELDELKAKSQGSEPSAQETSSDATTALVAHLEEMLGSDLKLGEPFKRAFDDAVDRAVAKVKEDYDSELASVQKHVRDVERTHQRKLLEKDYPGLKTEDRFQKVLGHMERADIDMAYACQVEFSTDLVEEARKAKTRLNKARDEGSRSVVSTRGTTPPERMGRGEASDALLRAMMDGDGSRENEMRKALQHMD